MTVSYSVSPLIVVDVELCDDVAVPVMVVRVERVLVASVDETSVVLLVEIHVAVHVPVHE